MNENATKVGIRFDNNVTGQKKLETLADNLEKIRSSLNGIDGKALQNVATATNQVKETRNQTDKLGKKIKGAFDNSLIAKFTGVLQKTVTTMKSLSKYTSVASDYYENWNLFQNAFQRGGKVAINTASDFVETMSKMYGLDESWGYKTVGIFKELSSAMGIAEETGTRLSKLMLQMSLDISSLYNVDVERASSVLQSSLAGQTKPIRGLTGADITQATLQTTLDNLGIDKAVADLSYAEKRLIIIVSLTEQLKDSIGDMADTIESPANQTRVLASQWERLTRAVGNVFLPIMAKVLPYINAVLMVLTDILNVIADIMADIFHFDKEQFNIEGVADTSDVVDGLADNLDTATGNANNLKDAMSGLRGFDKLNNLTTPKDTGKIGGGAGGVSSDILDAFNNAYSKYQDMLKKVKMKATEIAEKIKKWLGFSDGSYKNLKKISTVLGVISGLSIFGTIMKIYDLFKKSSLARGLRTVVSILKDAGTFLFKILNIGPLFESISVGFQLIAEGSATFGQVFTQLILPALGQVAIALGGIVLIGVGIYRAFEGISDLIKKGWNFDGIIKTIEGIALVVAGVGVLLGGWTVAIVAGIVALGAFLTELVVKNWESISKFIGDIWNYLSEHFIDPLVKFVKDIANFVYTYAIKPIIDFFTPIIQAVVDLTSYIINKIVEIVSGVAKAVASIVGKVIEIYAKIIEIFIALGKALYNYIIKPIFDFIVDVVVWVETHIFAPLRKTFGKIASWFFDNVIKPIYDGWCWVRDGLIAIFKTVGTAVVDFISGSIKSTINGILSSIEWSINKFIRMLNKAIDLINLIPDVNITKVQELAIPRLKSGKDFVPKDYYGPVYLDYGERVLTQQENRDYTANKNASQNSYKQAPSTYNIYVGTEKVAQVVLNQFDKMARENGKPIEIMA